MLLLDAAAKRDLLRIVYKLDSNPQCIPLFFTDNYRKFIDVGPVLVVVNEHSPITGWFLENDVFLDTGILLSSRDSLEDVANFLIKLLDAKTDEGEFCLFRFYDPFVMVSLLLDAESKGILSIIDKASSFLINYYDANNQNLWGEFVKKDHVSEYQKTTEPIIFDDKYRKLFDDRRIRHAINQHIIAHSKLRNIGLRTVSRQLTPNENTLFSITSHYSEESVFVSDELYNEATERLILYETTYHIDNFNYLAECDLLLEQACPDEKDAMHTILLTDTFIGDRLYLCRQILEKRNGGHYKAS